VQVTISGSGFGSAQGSGVVWLCGGYGAVKSWSDTEVVAAVTTKAVSGVTRVRQNGFWSNTVAVNLNNTAYRTVIPPGAAWMAGHQSRFGLTGGRILRPNTGARSKMAGSVVQRFTEGDIRLTPDILNIEIGESRTIQALDEAGLPVTGLTWTSSNNNVVSLSIDDPPVLTALSAGEATITAGTATAQVTVWPGALPVGTKIWSNSGTGSGIFSVVPAVPSSSGVADVFAVWGESTVSAITSDGATAWTASLLDAGLVVADFQGGLIISEYGGPVTNIAKLDGLTGQRSVLYTMNEPYYLAGIGVHTDGTIFVVQNSYTYLVRPSVIGIDPSGVQKFNVPIGGELGNGEDPPFISRALAGEIMIAGDGYAYIPYADQVSDGNSGNVCNDHMRLLRISTGGAVDNIHIRNWTDQCWEVWASAYGSTITNGDTGTLFSWTYRHDATDGYVSGLTLTAGAAATHIGAPPGQAGFAPYLQTQDGGFVGGGGDAEGNPTLVAIGASGSLKWSVNGWYQPQIATADNGVIATDGDGVAVVFDETGAVTGQMASLPIESWKGNAYLIEQGSVGQITGPLLSLARTLWANWGGNPSRNNTASRPWHFALAFQNDFTFTPCRSDDGFGGVSHVCRTELATDISSHAARMKEVAFKAVRDAYSGVPVRVIEGLVGDDMTTVLNEETGQVPPGCGSTNVLNPKLHEVGYLRNMMEAQDALQLIINNAQDLNAALAQGSIIRAIGRGIGNIAAHEIAHHFLVRCCAMDANPEVDENAKGTFNATGCSGVRDPSPWTGYWPDPRILLHWQQPALDALGRCLGGGWRVFGSGACH